MKQLSLLNATISLKGRVSRPSRSLKITLTKYEVSEETFKKMLFTWKWISIDVVNLKESFEYENVARGCL